MEGQLQTMSGGRTRVLNRDVIKYFAMFTMLLNHIAHMFLLKGTPLYELLEDIGFFTAPVMCYFLVEGYEYTRSKVKYGLRLLLFAVISQIPFMLAFEQEGLSMIYTLFCCFLILVTMEKVDNQIVRAALGALLMLATVYGDWAIVAPLFTIFFYRGRGDRRKTAIGFLVCFLLFSMLNVQSYMNGEPGDWTAYAVCHGLLSGVGILAAGIVILFFYNGERMERGKNFSKWFFYLFYPGHLFVLYWIKTAFLQG